ncbi:MAG: glycosyltransferase [Xanthobacteraceae bacterium]
MQGSLIICTKNRAQQLKRCLEYVDGASKPKRLVEIVIVDNNSSDETKSVVEEHQKKSRFATKYIKCEKAGLGSARNSGVHGSVGEWLIFTDDDCYIEEEFFINFFRSITETNLHLPSPSTENVLYGSGQILPYDTEDDSRVSALTIEKVSIVLPFTVISPGTVQGANMFFHRSIFEKIGGFNERMGAGTPFPCEDIEMAARASLAGYFGAQVPDFKVVHHHKRKTSSFAAVSLIEGYDYGRGAYYADLLARGTPQAWDFWGESIKESRFDSASRLKLARELYGASKYLEFEPDDLNKPPQKQIRDLKTTVRALTEERDGLRGQLTTLVEQHASAHAEALAERDGLLAERDGLKGTLAERDAQVTSLNQAVAALRASTSWRITAPLRRAARLLRHRKGPE